MSEERIRTRDLIDATRSIQQDDTIGSRRVHDKAIKQWDRYSDTRQTDGRSTKPYENGPTDDIKGNAHRVKQCCCLIL